MHASLSTFPDLGKKKKRSGWALKFSWSNIKMVRIFIATDMYVYTWSLLIEKCSQKDVYIASILEQFSPYNIQENEDKKIFTCLNSG